MATKSQKTINAVIGFPLNHSQSPTLHNLIYAESGIDAELIKDEDPNIANLVERIKTKPYSLIAVTIPHKQTIMPYLDEIDEEAKKIGAVNTVINKNGKLYGHNTDITGIKQTFAGVEIKNKKVLIMGAGGVTRPVAYFIQQNDGQILIQNRTRNKAEKLAQDFGGKIVELSTLDSHDLDIIINTTPIGMYPKINESPLPTYLLRAGQTVFDIVYNPMETKLLKEAKNVGAKTISGIKMFEAQARAQIKIWMNNKITI